MTLKEKWNSGAKLRLLGAVLLHRLDISSRLFMAFSKLPRCTMRLTLSQLLPVSAPLAPRRGVPTYNLQSCE